MSTSPRRSPRKATAVKPSESKSDGADGAIVTGKSIATVQPRPDFQPPRSRTPPVRATEAASRESQRVPVLDAVVGGPPLSRYVHQAQAYEGAGIMSGVFSPPRANQVGLSCRTSVIRGFRLVILLCCASYNVPEVSHFRLLLSFSFTILGSLP
jgi:hypothetical protein